MDVRTVPIDAVTPYERNPRKNLQAVGKVATSLREFGWRQPIVVDENMVVVVGHTRLLAAKSLGMTEVPVHVAVGLPPEKVRAYRLADNRTGEEAEWDDELLALEITELDLTGFDAKLAGFDDDELAKLRIPEDATAPNDFGAYDETIETEHQCPKCGYLFSGGKTAPVSDAA
jgi:ParB-like chromosome segregation protein Spo0J